MDARLIDLSDRRYDRDVDGETSVATFGIDRTIGEGVVAGFSVGFQWSDTTSFDGLVKSETEGFTAGPYLAWRLSDRWAADGSLTYGESESKQKLIVFDGESRSQQYSGSLNIHGQYDLDGPLLRPKGSIFYMHSTGDAYDMRGSLLGRDLTLRFPDSEFDYGMAEASLELSNVFGEEYGHVIMPYGELTARYEFERPQGGEILSANLTVETPQPFLMTLRTGVRALLSQAVLVEIAAGYLSLGQPGLDIWEGKLYVSYRF